MVRFMHHAVHIQRRLRFLMRYRTKHGVFWVNNARKQEMIQDESKKVCRDQRRICQYDSGPVDWRKGAGRWWHQRSSWWRSW